MPNTLTFIQGGGQSAQLGAAFANPLVVRVTDSVGNGVAAQGVVFSVPRPPDYPADTPSGRFSGAATYTTNTDGNGYAFATVTAYSTPGTWTGLTQLTADLMGSSCNWTLTNLPVVPHSVAITTGTNQKAALNTDYGQLRATVKDSGGNGLAGVTVQFSVPAGHGTFAGGVTTVTAATTTGGAATAPTFTADNTAGPFTVTVTVPVAPTLSATTTWTNVNVTIPTTVQNISGGGQSAVISTSFANALQCRVLNGLGTPVPGVTVTYTVPASGASCTLSGGSTASAVTDASGYASSPVPLANATVGTYFVTVAAAGATGAQFQLTNAASYLPEVCTTSAAPIGATNVGAGTATWSNPTFALSGATGASVSIPEDTATRTLLCSPIAAAALAPIEDGAIITKFVATFDVMGTIGPTGGSRPNYQAFIMDGATIRKTASANSPPSSYSARTETFLAPFQNGTTISGAQLKAGNFGFGLKNSGSNDGSISVRLVKLSVCYQNPDVPPVVESVEQMSLKMCEV